MSNHKLLDLFCALTLLLTVFPLKISQLVNFTPTMQNTLHIAWEIMAISKLLWWLNFHRSTCTPTIHMVHRPGLLEAAVESLDKLEAKLWMTRLRDTEVRRSLPTRTIWPVGVRGQKKKLRIISYSWGTIELWLNFHYCLVCACSFAEAGLCAQACEVCVHMPQTPT